MKTIDDADYIDDDICPWSMELDCSIAPKRLNRIKIISETLMEMHLMTMTGLYLMALIG